jgi:NAD(P)-dependent dehydrogenase (short-subunit alcohol dehydrogenase family)
MDFENRVAIVTGGTGALGGAVVKDLLASGARVAVAYRNEAEWKALVRNAGERKEQLLGVRVDLTHATEVESFEREVRSLWGRIDFLVAVAGGFAAGKTYTTEEKTWDHMFNLNFRSLVNCLRAVVPMMIQQNFGRIVTISTGSILQGGGAGMAAYAVSKGAVRQLSEILAEELKSYDIHVHCLMPGTIDTPANRKSMPNADVTRWVKTEDVARVIHFLLSDDARAVRSVVVPVLGAGN